MPLVKDCRFALRQLGRSPGFTLVVLATLGLSIGANTAVFSVLEAVVLRPAPYPRPDRLALVVTAWRLGGSEGVNDAQSAAQFEAVRDLVPALDCAAFAGGNGANFTAAGHLEYVEQQRVSAGFFRVLGVAPQFGREFTRAEDAPGAPPAAVLSYGFWQRIFHGDVAAIGQAIHLRGEPYTIVGIMPRDFRSAAPVDVWTPLRPSRTGEGADANYQVVARIKPGIAWEQAGGQLRSLPRDLLQGADVPRGAWFEEHIVPLQRALTQGIRSQLLLTWGAVLVVLLIGCVNIAGLLLARSGTRAHEIATRMALGGGRAAIVRQLLAESVLLAAGGGAAGIAIGALAIYGLKRMAGRLVLWAPIQLDAQVLAAMMALALLTSLLFGLAPAFATSRVDIRAVLLEGGRGANRGRSGWARQALVAGEVALSLVLLVGAGLLVRTLVYLNALSPGFDTRQVVAAQASLQDARYRAREAVTRLFSESLDRIRRIPGVQSAAVALTLPYQRPLNFPFRKLEGSDTGRRTVETVYLTPGYFETMRIPVLRGRAFRDSDTAESARVVVVSQSFAAKFFRGGDAVGRHVEVGGQSREIAGIVGDVQQHSGLSGEHGPYSVDPTLYLPVTQTSDGFLQVIHTWFAPHWVVRSTTPKSSLAAQLQAAVNGVDAQLPLASFQTVDELQALVTGDERLNATLFSVFAGLALLLAAVGLAGLISQSVTERTREIAVRMALGATAGQAMTSAMKPGIVPVLCGIVTGGGLALATAPLLRHMIWGVRPADPATFGVTAAVLLVAAGAASLVPVLRILRLDPARTLRG